MKFFKEESGAYGNSDEGGFGLDGPSFPAIKKKGVVGEDAPVNSSSGGEEGGQIAGIGIKNATKGSTFSEPGVSKTKYKDTKSPLLWPEMMRRTVPNMVKEEKKKVKIKLDPEKEVGYTVHSVGPGRKLTLTKSGTTKVKDMKEEKKPLLSKDALRDYINKASDNRAKNQSDFDFYYKKKNEKKYGKAFRNVINRRKGIRAATDRLVKEETFAGAVVFEVSSHTFHNAKMEKRKGKHWRTYLDECDELSEIRQYAKKNPNKPIVLQNRNTNEMVYVKYGKAR